MKKLFLLFSMMALAFNASADNVLVVEDVHVRPGGNATIAVKYDFESELICGYQFDIQLPTGISRAGTAQNGETIDETWTIGSNKVGDGQYRFATFSYGDSGEDDIPRGNIPVTDHQGVLMYIPISAAETLTDGTSLEVTLFDAVLPENTGADIKPEPITFNIVIDDDAVDLVLNENDTEIPTAKDDANVKVIRTINANEWSTICLPFAMTEEKVKEVFGNDVQIGNFAGITTSYLDEEEEFVSKIDVKFSSVTNIESNHPYIIKTSNDISEFNVLHVNIQPSSTPRVAVKGSYMFGNYENGTKVPLNSLFLSENKFWYSTGATKIKGFRGYFTFRDILAEVEDAGAKINIAFDGEATAIDNINKQNANEDIFSVSGMNVGKNVGKDASRLQRGVYIVNGKKVVKK